MKIMLCFLMVVPLVAFSKSLKEFNTVITREVDQEIRKDEEKFKSPAFRAPASVTPAVVPSVEEPKKIDKTVRQIGPNSW
jgi:hypothetical protein